MEPDATANDITLGAGGVWFVGRPRGANGPLETAELERIDPATDAVDRPSRPARAPRVIAAGGNALWSTGYLGGHVRGAARSDARSGEMRRINIGIYGDLVTADDQAVYYVASIGNRVARVSTRTGTLTNSMTLASDESLAAGNVPPSPTDAVFGAARSGSAPPTAASCKIDSRLRRDPRQHPGLPERARDRLRRGWRLGRVRRQHRRPHRPGDRRGEQADPRRRPAARHRGRGRRCLGDPEPMTPYNASAGGAGGRGSACRRSG